MTADGHTSQLDHADPDKLVDVLARLEGERRRPAGADRRQFRRFVVRGEARLEPLTAGTLDESHVVLLRDVGYAGLGFLTDRPLKTESKWRVRFYHSGPGIVFGSQPIAVRHCRPIQSNLYMVGASFIAEPYLLSMLGVDDSELRDETRNTAAESESAEYRAPDALA